MAQKRGLRWQTLHDGIGWARAGILPLSPELELLVKLPTELRVTAHGHAWKLRLPETAPAARIRGPVPLRDGRYFGLSVLAHIGLIALLLTLAHSFVSPREILPKVEGAPASRAASGGSAGGITYAPFSGISYTEFRARARAAERAANPVGALLGDLARFQWKGGGHATTVEPTEGDTAPALPVTDAPEATLTQALQARPETKPRPHTAPATTLPATDQAELRGTFRGLGESLRHLYSRLLSRDPELAVTVSYEVTVTESGYLSLSGFSLRGHYRPDSAARLKAGITEILRNTRVSPRLVGSRLKGENVFAR